MDKKNEKVKKKMKTNLNILVCARIETPMLKITVNRLSICANTVKTAATKTSYLYQMKFITSL